MEAWGGDPVEITVRVALPESVVDDEQAQQLEGLLRQKSLLPA